MKNFTLLSKKSLSFALFVLVSCSQSTFSMEPENSASKHVFKWEYSRSGWNWFKPFAYVRWALGSGEYAPRKVIDKEKMERLERIQGIALEKRDLHIAKLERKLFDLEGVKNPSYYSMMWKNKKKTAGILLGCVATGAVIGVTTCQLRKNKMKRKMPAGRLADINEEIVNMYQSIDDGIEETENLFVKTCNNQREIIINEMKNTELQTLMGNIRKEAWVKENLKKIKREANGLKNIQGLIRDSILDGVTITKSCRILGRIHDNLKKVASKKTENFEKTTGQIAKDYTYILQNIENSPRYSSSLRLILSGMKTMQKDLFGGADKSEEFQLCELQINPAVWHKGIDSNYKKLKSELDKINVNST